MQRWTSAESAVNFNTTGKLAAFLYEAGDNLHESAGLSDGHRLVAVL